MIIAFIIWIVVALLFIGIGFSCLKSEKPVGFFTFIDAPEVTDVKKYNRAVAAMWFLFAMLFAAMGLPLLRLEQNNPTLLPVVFGVVAWAIAMMIAFTKIEAKYKK